MAYRLPGSAAYEQVGRLNSLDQFSPPASGINMNYQRRFADATIGTLLGYFHQYGTACTYNNGGGISTATAGSASWTSPNSTTMTALSSTYVNVSFTAVTTQVIVQISAAYAAANAGDVSLILCLFTHGTSTQVGYHTICRPLGSTATINEDVGPLYAEILVTGLTPGTTYEYDLAWADSSSTATFTLTTGGATSGAGATTDYGAFTIKVLSA